MTTKIALSCGLIIFDEMFRMLVAHPTGKPFWDIFKGRAETGEVPYETALRETHEESGLIFEASNVREIGLKPYSSKRNMHLFYTVVDSSEIKMDSLFCHSMVNTSPPFPEMDLYAWMSFIEFLANAPPNMNRLMKLIHEEGLLPFSLDQKEIDIPPVSLGKNAF